MSACTAFVERVSDYLDGELGTAALVRFAGHRAGCPGCRRYLDQMRRTLWLLGQLDRGALASGRDDGRQVRSTKHQPCAPLPLVEPDPGSRTITQRLPRET